MGKIKAGIIGATGYAGAELLRLLMNHPDVQTEAVSSVSFAGKRISEVYPAFYGVNDSILTDEDAVIKSSDVVFASLPHGLCEKIAKKAVAQGKKFIDLGADFRLADEKDYQQWYGLDYSEKEIRERSRYCIPELHRSRLTNDIDIVGNPGCYPTSIALALAPLVEGALIDKNGIIIDSKSGVTGAGRGLSQMTHYPDSNEAFQAYKVAEHRHTPEIEQTLSELAGEDIIVTFVPHLLPVNRGILSTVYTKLRPGVGMAQVQKAYHGKYGQESFIRVLRDGDTANLKHVKYSNYCDISLHFDERTGRLIVISVIDNMVKGAAGQAIQNMNLLLGLEETAGLRMIPPSF